MEIACCQILGTVMIPTRIPSFRFSFKFSRIKILDIFSVMKLTVNRHMFLKSAVKIEKEFIASCQESQSKLPSSRQIARICSHKSKIYFLKG